MLHYGSPHAATSSGRSRTAHVVRGERLISEQKVRIANLERDGHDSTTARELLETYRTLQVEHIKSRDRIIKELEE
jgi:hypothetical protein